MRERVAQENVENQGFEAYLPLIEVMSARRTLRLVPMFPCYMFVRFDPAVDRWRAIASSRGVKRVFGSTPETPTAVPEWVMTGVREAERGNGRPDVDGRHGVPLGAAIRVGELTGVCEWSTEKRVGMLLTLMGRECRTTVDRDEVEMVT